MRRKRFSEARSRIGYSRSSHALRSSMATWFPKPSLIEVFAPVGPDRPLDESVRSERPGNRLDLINLMDPKIRQPALKTKQRIVIRGERCFGTSLSRDRTVQHPTTVR